MNSTPIVATYLKKGPPDIAVIGLHGYTGDEHVLLPLAKTLAISGAKWFCPRAPYKNPLGHGYTWFIGDDVSGWRYEESFQLLRDLVGRIRTEGFPERNIFLLGFSQGACLAMDFMARLPFAIGGIIPIAGFIKFQERFREDASAASRGTPVYLFHGQEDDIVPFADGQAAEKLFRNLNYNVTLTGFPGKHKIPLSIQPTIKSLLRTGR